MTRSIFRLRVLLLLSLVLSGFASAPLAAAQEDTLDFEPDYFLSELSDIEIELTRSDFEIVDAAVQSYPGGEGEIVQIQSDTAFIQVAFYDDADTNLETMELYNEQFEGNADDWEILDQVEDGEVVTTFALATVEGEDLYYFLSVTEDVAGNVDVLEGFYSREATFFEDLAEAQDTIEIDGDPFLADVDAADLEASATGGGDDTTTTGDDEGTSRGRTRDEGEDPDNGSTRGQSSGGDTYEFEVVTAEMTVSGDVQVADAVVNAPGLEQVQLDVAGSDTVAIVQLVQARSSAEETLDTILENFSGTLDSVENVGTDADASSAWSLDRGVTGTDEAVIFIYVETDRFRGFHYVEVVIAGEGDFLDHLDILGSDVEVDGEPAFSGVDVDELDALLSGGAAPDEPEDDPDEGSGTSSSRRTDARIDDPVDPDETRERSRDREDAGGIDLESQGLISESEFESLQYGYIVAWDETVWTVDTEWELSATSDTETGIDAVILFWEDGNASMLIQVMPADGSAPADFVDTWESDDFVTDAIHEDAEVLLADSGRSSGAVIYLTYDDDGNELMLVQEVIDIDGGDTVAVVTMFSSPEEVADAYADAEDLVTVDGLDIVGTFTPREIEGAVAP